MLPGQPDEPIVSQIYRGFLLELPRTVNEAEVFTAEYQYRSSPDNSLWETWATLGIVGLPAQYRFIHDNLYVSVYYQYRMRLTGYDGTVTDWSDYAMPGNGGVRLQDFPVDQADQLASSLGTVSYGYMRGVVFETSPNYPKVRFDPNGFYAINNGATPLFINAFTGDITVKGGTITGARIATSNTTSQIVMAQNGFYAYDTSTPASPSTPIQFNPSIGLYQFGGHVIPQGIDFNVAILGQPLTPGGTVLAAPGENAIRWNSGGYKQAEIAGGISQDNAGSIYITTAGQSAVSSAPPTQLIMGDGKVEFWASNNVKTVLGPAGKSDFAPMRYYSQVYNAPDFVNYTIIPNIPGGVRKVEWSLTSFMQSTAAAALVGARLDIDGGAGSLGPQGSSYLASEIQFFFNQLNVHCFMGWKTFYYDFGSTRTAHSFLPRWSFGSGQTTDWNDLIMITIW